MYRPLADRIRPTDIDEVLGQEHILGRDGILRRIIDSGKIPNMIFYGPSGCGKTTVANIIARSSGRTLHKLNATTAGLADIKDVMSDVGTMMAPEGVLLYLDEIQYFNKKQQQSLLEFVENGKITLIASTTENPYFYVYNALLSRSTVFEFKALDGKSVIPAVERGFRLLAEESGEQAEIEDGVVSHVAFSSGGDVRKALNAVELLYSAGRRKDGRVHITLEDAKAVSQRSAMRYDKSGDEHYDIISALQKSIRGSDRTRHCTTSPGLWRRGIYFRPAADCLLLRRRTSALPIRRQFPLSRRVWTAPFSLDCRRREYPWQMQLYFWPRRQSPIQRIWG